MAAALLVPLVGLAGWPGLIARADPADCTLTRSVRPPSPDHPFGFDVQGCDYLAQTVYATRTSLVIAVLVLTATGVVALVLGSLAGFLGGWIDAVVSRATDVWSGIPLVLGGVVVLSGTERRGVLEVSLVLSVFGWPAMVRLLRGSVIATRQLDYVLAARALGASRWRLLRRHVLPGATRPLLVYLSAYAGVVIAAEATLTFAGVGLQQPTQSWGILLHQAQHRVGDAPHLLVFPALFLTATVCGFVLLGEALRRGRDG